MEYVQSQKLHLTKAIPKLQKQPKSHSLSKEANTKNLIEVSMYQEPTNK